MKILPKTARPAGLVLYPPSRIPAGEMQVEPSVVRDEQVLHLAASLLARGDEFARACLSQTNASRAASLRRGAPEFHDPVGVPGLAGIE